MEVVLEHDCIQTKQAYDLNSLEYSNRFIIHKCRLPNEEGGGPPLGKGGGDYKRNPTEKRATLSLGLMWLQIPVPLTAIKNQSLHSD